MRRIQAGGKRGMCPPLPHFSLSLYAEYTGLLPPSRKAFQQELNVTNDRKPITKLRQLSFSEHVPWSVHKWLGRGSILFVGMVKFLQLYPLL